MLEFMLWLCFSCIFNFSYIMCMYFIVTFYLNCLIIIVYYFIHIGTYVGEVPPQHHEVMDKDDVQPPMPKPSIPHRPNHRFWYHVKY